MGYHFSTLLDLSFVEAEQLVITKLKEQGFGVLTEIDVKATLKEKLDVDVNRYKILGACNPNFAHQALQIEPKIGTMLPCNVILRELENGMIEVSAVDPMASMRAVDNPALTPIASQVQQKLGTMIAELTA